MQYFLSLFSYSLCLFVSFFQLSSHHGPSRLSTHTPLSVPGPAINHWFPTASHALPPICQHLMHHTTSCDPLRNSKPLTLNNVAFLAIEVWLKYIALKGIDKMAQVKTVSLFKALWILKVLLYSHHLSLRASWRQLKQLTHSECPLPGWQGHLPVNGPKLKKSPCWETFIKQPIRFKNDIFSSVTSLSGSPIHVWGIAFV